MKTIFRPSVLCVLPALLLTGCVVLALSAGAAGGYAISKDEIEGFTDKSYEHVWQKAWAVLNEEGAVELANKEEGKIQAIVDDSKIKLELEQVSPKSLKVRIQARKTMNLFPDIKLAQSLYQKVMTKSV